MHRVRVTRPVDGIPETTLYEALSPAGDPVPGPRVAVIGRMHGNEPVGAYALERLDALAPDWLAAGSVLGFVANVEAAGLHRRHTPGGGDMNRLWDADTLERLLASEPGAMASYEERRVRELAPLVLACDAVLDLHSTSRPAPPFLVFRDDQRHARLATRLGVRRLVTGVHEAGILDGGLCSNVGLRAGEFGPRLGFTFEAGQHSEPANAARAWGVVARLLAQLGMWSEPLPQADEEPEVYEIVERFVQAAAGAPQYRFVGYEGGEAGSGRIGPVRHLESFEAIEADEIILRRGRDTVVRAAAPFTMLMPAPATDPGTDLYYVAQRRPLAAASFTELTHAEARLQAEAVERVLDLLTDDEFARGCTRVSCDDRCVFDWTADSIARVLRLPKGHPHRRVTIVGRGDWGGDEAVRRTGQRYHRALHEAIVCGLPIERIQLLRGASLDWLDGLSSPEMLEMLRRRYTEGQGDAALRFFVSGRQPHTVSILVAGDIARALRDGDVRHARVGLVIEATTIEPDHENARVRTQRAALFSARPAVLAATASLIEALRAEHRQVMASTPLAREPAFQRLLGEDGAIEAVPDPDALAAMRRALRQIQLLRWRQALLPVLQGDRRIGGGDARGKWLASAMVATGIRDTEALLSLLSQRPDGDWELDVARLDAAVEDPDALRPPRSPRRGAPPQPLLVQEVDADNLERWIGWKRYLHTAQLVPDNRGKDLDLAFTEEAIHDRIVGAFERARAMAQADPGGVMLVLAGDGHAPSRERPASARRLLLGHRAALLDPNLRYLRIQHAQGTHLAWMKDFLELAAQRPAGAQPVGLQWEGEHGASLNVLLVAVRDREVADPAEWTLEGWRIASCGIVVADLEGGGGQYQIGVFTEGAEEHVNQDLLHFGRAHCEGLLQQGGPRVAGTGGDALEAAVLAQLCEWIDRVRTSEADGPPSEPSERARWVADRLGLADATLARALAALHADEQAERAARALWASIGSWPGALWPQIERAI